VAKQVEPTYLGLLSQTFIDRYEFDIYGYVSITGFKYVVFKIEQRLNPVNASTLQRQMRLVFNKLQSLHTQMMHNPFFNFDSHGCFPGATGTAGKSSTGRSTLLPD